MTEEQKGYRRDFYITSNARPTAVFGNVGQSRSKSYSERGKTPNGGVRRTDGKQDTLANEKERARRGRRKMGEARRSAGERRRTLRRRRAIVLFAICVLLLAIIAGTIYRFMFVVKNINISGSVSYTAQEITEAGKISEGINLYSFRGSTLEESVTFACPYISHLTVDRRVPDTVNIIATEETAVYYAEIYGEYKLISESLRVLDTVDEDELPDGLIKLKLPAISYAVAGRQIVFASERRMSDIKQLLNDVAQSDLADRLCAVDLRDKYNVRALCDNLYLLVIGENEDTAYKLRVAARVLDDSMFIGNENKYRIDLTIKGKTGVLEVDDVALE